MTKQVIQVSVTDNDDAGVVALMELIGGGFSAEVEIVGSAWHITACRELDDGNQETIH